VAAVTGFLVVVVGIRVVLCNTTSTSGDGGVDGGLAHSGYVNYYL